jgi:hypothetical protein
MERNNEDYVQDQWNQAPPKKLYKKVNKAKSCLFEMIYKIDKLLAN